MSSAAIRRVQHGNWFIQSQKEISHYVAWASKDRSVSPLLALGDVYFDFGKTEYEAISKVIAEVDAICPMPH